MNTRALAAVASLSLFATACPDFVKATGQPFSTVGAVKDKAIVYFYRPAQRFMSDYAFFMSIPETENNCFKVASGGYWAHVADPGTLNVMGALTPSNYVRVSLDLKAGDERYVEIDIRDDKAVATEVSPAEAKSKIGATRQGEVCGQKFKG